MLLHISHSPLDASLEKLCRCPSQDLKCDALQGGMGSVAGAAVELAWRRQSLAASRQLCDSLLHIPSPGGSFFQDVISLEQATTAELSSAHAKRIRHLYEVRSLLH